LATIVPAHNTGNKSNLEKDNGDGEAAGHPLTVELDFAGFGEVVGDSPGKKKALWAYLIVRTS
jgi:hypothetical protein